MPKRHLPPKAARPKRQTHTPLCYRKNDLETVNNNDSHSSNQASDNEEPPSTQGNAALEPGIKALESQLRASRTQPAPAVNSAQQPGTSPSAYDSRTSDPVSGVETREQVPHDAFAEPGHEPVPYKVHPGYVHFAGEGPSNSRSRKHKGKNESRRKCCNKSTHPKSLRCSSSSSSSSSDSSESSSSDSEW